MRVQLEVEAPAGPGPCGEGPGEVEVVDSPAGELRGEWRGRPGHRLIQQREIHPLLRGKAQHAHLRACWPARARACSNAPSNAGYPECACFAHRRSKSPEKR